MKAKATLKQIAKELGVSVSTVSKALSDSQEISQATKDKIKEFFLFKVGFDDIVTNVGNHLIIKSDIKAYRDFIFELFKYLKILNKL